MATETRDLDITKKTGNITTIVAQAGHTESEA